VNVSLTRHTHFRKRLAVTKIADIVAHEIIDIVATQLSKST
jgi:hypothetical protein